MSSDQARLGHLAQPCGRAEVLDHVTQPTRRPRREFHPAPDQRGKGPVLWRSRQPPDKLVNLGVADWLCSFQRAVEETGSRRGAAGDDRGTAETGAALWAAGVGTRPGLQAPRPSHVPSGAKVGRAAHGHKGG
jgi:hypothetical protein